MKKFALLLLMPTLSFADTTLTLSWTEPTAREDGTKLQTGEIVGYDIRAQLPGQKWAWLKWHPSTVNSWNYVAKTPGEYCFQISATDNKKLKSKYSDSKCVQITSESPPSAPELKFIEIKWITN